VLDWIADLKGRRDKIPGDEKTLVEALELCPETRGAIAWDKRRGQLVAIRDGAWGEKGDWTTPMTLALLVYLQHFGIPAKEASLDRALFVVGRRNQIDPLSDWLDSLKWDHTNRLDCWLQRYAGAEGLEIICEIGSKFLVQMIARARVPGIQADSCLCLESDEQGVGKDQIARVLGGEFYAADLPSFHGRDVQQIACGSWLVGIGEFAAVRRSDLERVKSFVTAVADTFVPKYQRHPVTLKRWCCFLFTVNLDGAGYLTDSTGNRRIWPVKIRDVDIEALRRDRDQLFAEALVRFDKGEKWWPVGKWEWDKLGLEQATRRTEDAWMPIIAEWLEPRRLDEKPISTTEILTHALDVKPRDIGLASAQRVGRILRALGYERYQVRDGNQRGTWFYRLEPKEPKEPMVVEPQEAQGETLINF
jgi:predicted P-loop ATPase